MSIRLHISLVSSCFPFARPKCGVCLASSSYFRPTAQPYTRNCVNVSSIQIVPYMLLQLSRFACYLASGCNLQRSRRSTCVNSELLLVTSICVVFVGSIDCVYAVNWLSYFWLLTRFSSSMRSVYAYKSTTNRRRWSRAALPRLVSK